MDKAQTGFGPAYRLYETQDGWVQVVALEPQQWDGLCTTLGVDPSLDRRDAEAQLELRFRTKTAVSWSYNLDDAGVPNEVAIDVDGGNLMLFDADNERLGLVAEYEHPIMGLMRQFGNTIDFSEAPARVLGPPPRVGEGTREVLALLEDSGIGEALAEKGLVYSPGDHYGWAW